MPSLNQWSDRFEAIGVSKNIFFEAIRSKPATVSLEVLYRICHGVHAGGHNMRNSWELIMASNDHTWMRNRLAAVVPAEQFEVALLIIQLNADLQARLRAAEAENRRLRSQLVGQQAPVQDTEENDENIMPTNAGNGNARFF